MGNVIQIYTDTEFQVKDKDMDFNQKVVARVHNYACQFANDLLPHVYRYIYIYIYIKLSIDGEDYQFKIKCYFSIRE